MKKILFIFPREDAYDSQTVRDAPSGGTEKAVIFLGEALQCRGHMVQWVTSLKTQVDPTWPDVVISQEATLFESFPAARKIWWSHHFHDQPITQRNAPYARCFADVIVTLSNAHQENFKTTLKLDSVKIGHGVWLDEIVRTAQKNPNRLVYASTPFRGLERIPELFTTIRAARPEATIHLCSSMQTYGQPERDADYAALYQRLRSIEGVTFLGSLSQSELYQELAEASVFLYPCLWPETYCMVMDEALAHGCIPVVSDLGALSERVSPSFDLASTVIQLLRQPSQYASPQHASFVKQCPLDWLDIARQWEALFESR